MTLFAYGSLMFPEVWRQVTGADSPSIGAALAGFAAWKIRGEVYPGLARAPGESTPGVLYRDLSPQAFTRLDAFEGSLYIRSLVTVTTDDGASVSAFAYVVAPECLGFLEASRWYADEFRDRHLSAFLHSL